MSHLSIEPYLQPIPGDEVCGPSLRYEGAWDRLRELRREDDASLPTGVWQSELKTPFLLRSRRTVSIHDEISNSFWSFFTADLLGPPLIHRL